MCDSKEDNKLVQLLAFCQEYTNNSLYVYKICRDKASKYKTVKWFVVLQKLPDTKTNECRKDVVDKNYAKFRADKLRVVKIINTNKPTLTKKYITHRGPNMVKTKYVVNKIVESNEYDDNIDNVYSNGIHYFKTLLPAYYYRDIPDKYNGKWIFWHDNG